MSKVLKFILLAIPVFIGVIIMVFLIERHSGISLPEPTGDFAVGRTTYEWIDTTRIDSLALEAGSRRELFLWVWYPASKSNTNAQGEYLPAEWRDAVKNQQGLLARLLNRKLSKVKAHSVYDADPASASSKYPVVIIKTGIGNMATDYTTFAEELASQGYIVIASDAPYSSSVVVFSGGRIVNDNIKGNPGNITSVVDRNRRLDRLLTIWTNDTKFILDQLEQINKSDSKNIFHNRMNLDKVGIFGHALGGATAFRYCYDDDRCKAGVSINGIPIGKINLHESNLSKPFMFLMPDQGRTNDQEYIQIKRSIDTIYNQLPEGSAWINLKGARHFNFSDQAIIRERFVARQAGDIGKIGRRKGLTITAATLRAFFDTHLKGLKNVSVQDLPAKYPEIVFEK
jgi:dienelactone hydrolase